MPHSSDQLRILISGAADGIGLACAAAFAGGGAELILCDHDGTGLTRASDGCGAFSRFCDVVSDTSVAVFAAEIAEKFQSIDVLINAAGKRYVRSLGMMRMSRAFLPLLRKAQGRRLIVNVLPSAGYAAAEEMFPYAGSRESFERLSDALVEQTRGSSIKVVNMTPLLARPPLTEVTPGRPYAIEEIDERASAQQIVSLVAKERPGGRSRPVSKDRRLTSCKKSSERPAHPTLSR